ncbi:MAG: trehalase family glycosidase [Marinifilaceae bacterium]|jgi:putative isomerase|nr:trehalase family glycosidase [Marinifilaceae bacterium]
MKLLKYFTFILLFCSSCGNNNLINENIDLNAYSNLIDINGIPQNDKDLSMFGFSDLGAWHAYALPGDSIKNYFGFVGPLCMKDRGNVVSKSISKLKVFDNSTNKQVEFYGVKQSYTPGKLRISAEAKGLVLEMQLSFIDNRSSIINLNIQNKDSKDRSLLLEWSGDSMTRNYRFSKSDNQIILNFPDKNRWLCLDYTDGYKIHLNRDNYVLKSNKAILLSKGEEYSEVLSHSYYFKSDKHECSSSKIPSVSDVFERNDKRWLVQIKKCLGHRKDRERNMKIEKNLVKAIMTLNTNWRSPAGDLKFNGVFPSISYHGFYAYWSWDSWKHAVALSKYNTELAKESVRSMMCYQNEDGMIADCAYFDKIANNWRNTKPPMASWAVFEIYKQSLDVDFVKDMLPSLQKYHDWWYKNRDFDKNGLCEYGSEDGSLIAAKWESGMDNAVRFDGSKIHSNEGESYSLDQESVDLNAYLYLDKKYLSQLYDIVGDDIESRKLLELCRNLKTQISSHFWNDSIGVFSDIKHNGEFVKSDYGNEIWTAMYANIANDIQAQKIRDIMMDSSKFYSKLPMPTVTKSSLLFEPAKGYWRGPVWIDQYYFGVKALENYGFDTEVLRLKEQLFREVAAVNTSEPFMENYNPLTAEGLNARNFSWTAAFFILLGLEY